jgi:hypothetical protein
MRPVIMIAIVAAFALGFLVRPALGTEYLNLDGNWWNSLNASAKLSVAEGMTTAYEHGYSDGTADAATYATKHLKASLQNTDLAMNMMLSNPNPAFSKTFGTYVDEISDYYVNNPEMLGKFEVGAIVSCLQDKASANCLATLTKDVREHSASPKP